MSPFCSHYVVCSGCQSLEHFSKEKVEILRQFANNHALTLPDIISGEKFHYRFRSRLAIRGRSRSPKIGLFREHSHDIVDIPRCVVHHPVINDVTATLKMGIFEHKIPLYNERNHRGLLRYLQVVVERHSSKSQVVLVANSEDPEMLRPLASYLREKLGDSLHSLWFNGQTAQTNNILGNIWHRYFGEEAIREIIGGAEAFFPPGAFGQNNLNLFEKIIEKIKDWIPVRSSVVEFYSGVGSIGLSLLDKAEKYYFNEVSEASLVGLELALSKRSQIASKVEILRGVAGQFASIVDEVDTVIVDPPRKGLDSALLRALIEHSPRRLIYISCGLSSFLKEAEQLLSLSSFSLKEIYAYNLFPYTNHIETLALFEREG